jgi:hypothetical protein
MAKNVTITWDLPTQREGGGDLQPEELDYVQVNMSADMGANYTELARVPAADPQSVFIPDLEIGSWQFQFRVMDRLGQFDRTPHIEAVVVIDDSPPNSVSNVTVTQE